MLKSSITLDQCLIDFQDLNKLVSKKYNTNFANSGYQLISILKEVADYNSFFIDNIGIMHGTFIGMTDNWWKNSEASYNFFSKFFLHNIYDIDRVSKIFRKPNKFVLICHPIHYIINNYKNEYHNNEKGSVLFLPHSLTNMNKAVCYEFLIERIKILDHKFFPLDICIHVNDLSNETIQLFKKNNINIVCAGSRNDPQFLHRFFWICKQKKFSINLEFGSSVIYSSLIGLDIYYWDEIPIIRYWPFLGLGYQTTPDIHYRKVVKGFYLNNLSKKEFYDECFKITGGDYIIKSKDLYKIFNSISKDVILFNKNTLIPSIIIMVISFFYLKIKNIAYSIFIRIYNFNKLKHPLSEKILLDLIDFEEKKLT